MGNVEGRPVQHRHVEVPQLTSRPLPPLPKDAEESAEEDDYDLDTPPPYPPPPPPHEENGVKSKRVSWRFKDTNIFGGMKRGSWALNTQAQNDIYKSNEERTRNSQNVSDKNLSNTIALEDNNVVTVSVIGTPEKNSDALINTNNKFSNEGSQSWAVKNMQLIMNNEMKSGDIHGSKNMKGDSSLNNTNNINTIDSSSTRQQYPSVSVNGDSNHVETYPYPDVQSVPDHEGSMLPDLVSVRGQSKFPDNKNKFNVSVETSASSKHEYEHSNLPYALRTELPHQDIVRVEAIRIDYPEGKVKEISDYNRFDYDAECKADDNFSVESSTESDFNMGEIKLNEVSAEPELEVHSDKLDTEKSKAASKDSGVKSGKGKLKLSSCFGKPSIEGDISHKDIDGPLEDTSDKEIDVDKDTKQTAVLKPKKEGRKGLPSCFGDKKYSKKNISVDNKEHDTPDRSSDPNVNIPQSEEVVCKDISDLDVKGDIAGKKHKKQSKLSSCFGGKNYDDDDEKLKKNSNISSDDVESNLNGDKSIEVNDTADIEGNLTGSLNISIEQQQPADIAVSVADNVVINVSEQHLDPKFNIKGDLPTLPSDDVNLDFELTDPNHTEVDGKFRGKDINTDLKIVPDVDTTNITIEKSDYDLKGVKFDIPKVDLNLEGKSTQFDTSSDLSTVAKSSNVDNNLNLSIRDLDMPKISIAGEGMQVPTPEVDFSLERNLSQKVEFKQDIDLNIKQQNEGVITIPEIPRIEDDFNIECPKVPSSKIKMPPGELLLEAPKLELIDVKKESPERDVSKVKRKKMKGGPCSCAGKPKNKQLPKDEVYMPSQSLEVDDDIRSPSPKVEIEGKLPLIEGKVDVESDLEVSKGNLKVEKPKSSLGSCFGKTKSPKTESIAIQGDIDPTREGSVHLEAQKVKIEVKGNVNSPELEKSAVLPSDKKEIEAEKPKLKFGSCFGKKNSKPLNVEGNMDVSKVESSADVEAPKIEIDVKGDINVKTPELEEPLKTSPSKGKINTEKQKLNLGDCFGKPKTLKTKPHVAEKDINVPQIQGSTTIEIPKLKDVKGSVDVKTSNIEGSASVTSANIEVDVPKVKAEISVPEYKIEPPKSGVIEEVDAEQKTVVTPKIPPSKGKISFGSCFGKKKDSLEIGMEEPSSKSLKSDFKIKDEKKPHIDVDVSLKSNLDQSVELSLPEAKMKETSKDTPAKTKSKKVKGGICASCIGKRPNTDMDADVSILSPTVKVSEELPATEINIKVDQIVDVIVPQLPAVEDLKVEVDFPEVDVNVPDYDPKELKIDIPKIDMGIESSTPDIGISSELDLEEQAPKTDINIERDLEMSKSDIELDLQETHPQISTLDIKTDLKGKLSNVEVEAAIPTTDISFESPIIDTPGLKVSASEDLPAVELEISSDIKGKTPEIDIPKVKGKKIKAGPCDCIGKPKGKLLKEEVYLPSGNIENESSQVKCKTKGEIPTIESDVGIKADMEVPEGTLKAKKHKANLGSCFGKSKAPKLDENIDAQIIGGSVDIESPKLGIEVNEDLNIVSPRTEASIQEPSGKGKFGLGTCFGKKKSPVVSKKLGESVDITVAGPSDPKENVELMQPEVKDNVEIPNYEAEGEFSSPQLKVKGKKSSKFGSCFGKSKTPKLETEISSVDDKAFVKVSSKARSPEVEEVGERFEVQEPKVDIKPKDISGKRKLDIGSCFGKKKSVEIKNEGSVDVNIPSGELKASVKGPSEVLDPEVEVGVGIDTKAPKVEVKPKDVTGKGKLDLASCFGKKKQFETKKDSSVDTNIPGPSAEINIHSPKVEGSFELASPDAKIEGDLKNETRTKNKGFGSCFGKRKSRDLEIEASSANIEGTLEVIPELETPKLDVDIEGKAPDLSLSDPKLKSPEAEVSLSLKSPQPKKAKVGFGSCFGKKPKGNVSVKSDADPSVKASLPEVELARKTQDGDTKIKTKKLKGGICASCVGKRPKKYIDMDVEAVSPTVKVSGDLPSTDIKLKVDPVIDVGVPEVPILGDLDVEAEINSPKMDVNVPEYDLRGVPIDIPKVDIEIESSAPEVEISSELGLDIKSPKIDIDEVDFKYDKPTVDLDLEGILPAIPSLDLDIDLKGTLADVEAEVTIPTADITLENPKIVSPEVDVSASGDLPAMKLEICSDIKGETPEIDIPKVKGKKIKAGPCDCMGNPKGKVPKEEIYLPSGNIESKATIKSPQVKSEIKGEVPTIESDVCINADIAIPEGNLKAKKPRAKFGSCFGKPKAPKLEGDTDAQIDKGSADIKSPKLGIEVNEDLNVKSPKTEASIEKPTGKGKFGLGTCFGKKKSSAVSQKLEESVDFIVAGPSDPEAKMELIPEIKADVEVPNSEIKGELSGPKIKVKDKKSIKFGSCFGKSKTPELEAEIPSVVEKASVKITSETSTSEIEEVGRGIEVHEPKLDIKPKDVTGKGKLDLGSCFGKKKSVDRKKGSVDVNIPSGEVNTSLKGSANVPEVEVGGSIETKVPKVEVKPNNISGKGKLDLASCFGKKKQVETKKECSVDINLPGPSAEIDIHSPKVEGSVELVSSDVKVEGDMENEVSKSKKNKGFGSCFGKRKSRDLKITAPSANIGGSLEVNPELKTPKLDVDIEGEAPNPDLSLSSDPKLKSPEAEVSLSLKSPQRKKTKVGLGSCFGKKPKGNVSVKSDADPSVKTSLPEVGLAGKTQDGEKKIKTKKLKGGICASCVGKRPKKDIDMDAEAVSPTVKVSGDLPSTDVKLQVDHTVDVGIPELPTVGDLEVEAEINSPKIDVNVPVYDLKDVQVDIPKVDLGIESSAPKAGISSDLGFDIKDKTFDIDVGDFEINKRTIELDLEGTLPAIPSLDLDCDSKGTLPDVEGKVTIPTSDAILENPKIVSPEVAVSASGDLPAMKLEICSDIKGKTPEIDIPKVKGKKNKAGPCDCMGNPKGKVHKEEVYLPSESIESKASIESPQIKSEIKGEIPNIESNVGIKADLEVPEGNLKAKKSKAKLGSCFGKPKAPKLKGDIDAQMIEGSADIDSPKLGIGVKGDVNTESPNTEVSVEKPSGKGKFGLGTCFGKKKSPIVSKKLEEPVDIAIAGPSDTEAKIEITLPVVKADVEIPKYEAQAALSGPELKVKERKSSKFGSCFGKSKTPKLEAEIPSVADKASINISSEALSPVVGEVGGNIEVQEPKVDIKPKEISGKGKLDLGSCFGKKKSFEKKKEGSVDVNIPSGEVKVPIKESFEVLAPEVEVGGSIDTKAPKVEVKPNNISGKGKLDLASCFGKKKQVEMKKECSVDVNLPEPSAEIDIHSPKVEGSAEIVSSNVKAEGDMKNEKSKKNKGFGSCFGKRESKDLEIEAPSANIEGSLEVNPDLKTPKLDVDIEGEATNPELSLSSDPKLKSPEAEVSLSLKSPQPKKAKVGFGSCFGKKPKANVSVKGDADPSVKASLPEVELAEKTHDGDEKIKTKKLKGGICASCVGKRPKEDINMDVEAVSPTVKVSGDLPSTEVKLQVDPSIDVGVPELPTLRDLEVEAEISSPKIDVNVPDYDLKGVQIDFPKVDIPIESSAPEAGISSELGLDIKSPKIEIDECDFKYDKPTVDLDLKGVLPAIPSLDLDMDLKRTLADVEAEVAIPTADITLENPKLVSPEVDVSASGDLPAMKLEICGDIKGKTPEIDIPKVKGKKIKAGPCDCMGNPKGKVPKEEIYLPSGNIESKAAIELPNVESEIKGEIPTIESDVCIKADLEVPEGNLKTKKSKAKLGSCFGKPKAPKLEGDIDAQMTEGSADTKSLKLETGVKVDVNTELSVEKPSGKGKLGLGSCFGKKKSPIISKKLEESVDITVAGPSDPEAKMELKLPDVKADLEIPKYETEAALSGPELKLKERKSSKFGSCFGKKSKTPKLEAEIPSIGDKASIKIPSDALSPEIPEVGVDIEVQEPKVDIKPKDISGKGKLNLGSCFGKKKPVEIKQEGSAHVDIVSGEVKTNVKGSSEVLDPEVEVGGGIEAKPLKVEVKPKDISGKGKLDLASCFGKKKQVETEKECSVDVNLLAGPSAEIDIHSPNVEGNVEFASPSAKVEGSMKNERSKNNKGFGSCFGKRKSRDLEIEAPSANIEGSLEVDPELEIPKLDVNIQGETSTPDLSLSSGPKLKSPEADVSLSLKSSQPKKTKVGFGSCFGKKPKGNVSVKSDADPSVKASLPEVELAGKTQDGEKKIKNKQLKGGICASCVGKRPKKDINMDVEAVSPTVKVSGDLPSTEVKLQVDPSIDVGFPELPTVGDLDVETEINSPKMDVNAPEYDLKGVPIDIPKVDIEIESSAPEAGISSELGLDIKSPKIDIDEGDFEYEKPTVALDFEGILPAIPSLDLDMDLKGKLPDVEAEVTIPTADITLENPKIVSPEVDVSASEDLPAMKLEICSDIKGETPEIDIPKVKGKKIKAGPCDCMRNPKGKVPKEEIYLPSGNIESKAAMELPKVESEIKGEIPTIESDVSIKADLEVPEGNLKTKKSNAKLGSCFGKPKAPKVKGDIDAQIVGGSADIESTKQEIEVKRDVDIESPRTEQAVEKPSGKVKFGLGTCFGKKKSPVVSQRLEETIGITVPGPSHPEAKSELTLPEVKAEVEIPYYETAGQLSCPKLKVKEKKTTKFGSCLGKSKTPKLETEIPSVGDKASVKLSSEALSPEIEKVGESIEVQEPKMDIKPKDISGKGKLDIGSCFGKKKSVEMKKEDSADVNIPSGEFKASVKGSSEALAPELEVGGSTDVKHPKVEVKSNDITGKGKLDLASCFGKKKQVETKKEGSVDVNLPGTSAEVDIDSSNIEGGVKVASPDIKVGDINVGGNVDVNEPVVHIKQKGTSRKGKPDLGSCFGKKKHVGMESGSVEVEVLRSSTEVLDSPNVKGSVEIRAPEVKVEGEVKSGKSNKEKRFGLCFGNAKSKGNDVVIPQGSVELDPELKKTEINLGIKEEAPALGSLEGPATTSIQNPERKFDVDISAPKLKVKDKKKGKSFPSCFGKNKSSDVEVEVPSKNIDVSIEPDSKFSSPTVDVSFEGKSPEMSLSVEPDSKHIDSKGSLTTKSPKSSKVRLGSCFGKEHNQDAKVDANFDSTVLRSDDVVSDVNPSLPQREIKDECESGIKPKSKFVKEDLFGSCVGKKAKTASNSNFEVKSPKGDTGIDVKLDPNFEININKVPVQTDLDIESESHVPNVTAVEPKYDLKGVRFDIPKVDLSLNGIDPETDISSKLDINMKNVNKPTLELKTNLSENANLSIENLSSKNLGQGQIGFKAYDDNPNIDLIESLPYKLRVREHSKVVSDSRFPFDSDSKSNEPEISIENGSSLLIGNSSTTKSYNIDFPSVIDAFSDFSLKTSPSNDPENSNLPEASFENERFALQPRNEKSVPLKTSTLSEDHNFGVEVNRKVDDDKLPYELRVKPDIKEEFAELKQNAHFAINTPYPDSVIMPKLNIRSEFNNDLDIENQFTLSDQSIKPPEVPKRWFGLDHKKTDSTSQDDFSGELSLDVSKHPRDSSFSELPKLSPNSDTDSGLFSMCVQTGSPSYDDNLLATNYEEKTIPSEALSGFQSIQFVKKMVQNNDDDSPRAGMDSDSDFPEKIASTQDFQFTPGYSKFPTVSEREVESNPSVKRTVKVKTYIVDQGTDEPATVEEYGNESVDLEMSDASKLLIRKLADFDYEGFSSQPVIKRSIKVKTYKTKEDGAEPEETVEEYEDGNEGADLDRSEATKLLLRKLVDLDSDECSTQPIIKRTVKVKTYKTTEGSNEPEEIVEEYEEDAQDLNLNKSEATKLLIKKLADFDGQGISSQPVVKRTVKVKTYKTKEGSDEPEEIEEFEQTSDDMSISEFLQRKYPELGPHSQIFQASAVARSEDSTIPGEGGGVENAESIKEEK